MLFRRGILAGSGALLASKAFGEPITPPFSARLAAALGVGVRTIESFGTGIAGDGVTDDSVAIKAAHDAAYAAGVREVWCSKQYYAPTAYNLGNVVFRGPGALIGTYWKRVIPMSARSLSAAKPGVVPSFHLQRAAKQIAPKVVVQGDSLSTYGAANISETELLWPIFESAWRKSNPNRTTTFTNRAIGGSTILNYNNTGTVLQGQGLTLPTWFNNPAAPWSGFVTNLTPNVIMLAWGANGGTSQINSAISGVVSFYQGQTVVPDVLLVTCPPYSTQGVSGSGTIAAQEAAENAAGATRSYAEYWGLGLIDLHRLGRMMRDGVDVCSQVMTLTSTTGSMNLPATLPATQGDFDVTFTIDNTGGAAFGAGQQLAVGLSTISTNAIRISSSGGNLQLIGFTDAGLTFLSATNTGVALPTSVITFRVSIKNNWMQVWMNGGNGNFPNWEGQFMRSSGGQFQPAIAYASGSGATTINITSYISSQPALCQPAITDYEMYGVSPFPQGGAGPASKHPASPWYEAVTSWLVGEGNFSLDGISSATQAITAAGAIDQRAGDVQLTGPASGTYAITLAAPDARYVGQTMVIEMVATTSTNSVTLALTNVTGGTASATCTWNAAGQRLVLVALKSSWEVIKQDGVTLT